MQVSFLEGFWEFEFNMIIFFVCGLESSLNFKEVFPCVLEEFFEFFWIGLCFMIEVLEFCEFFEEPLPLVCEIVLDKIILVLKVLFERFFLIDDFIFLD